MLIAKNRGNAGLTWLAENQEGARRRTFRGAVAERWGTSSPGDPEQKYDSTVIGMWMDDLRAVLSDWRLSRPAVEELARFLSVP